MIHLEHGLRTPSQQRPRARTLCVFLGLSAALSCAHADTIYLPPCFSCTLNSTPPAGDTWVIQGNFVTIGMDGLVSEGSLINNADYLTNTFNLQAKAALSNNAWLNNFGMLTVAGSPLAALNNSGTLWNQGTLKVFTGFESLSGRVINQGQIVIGGSLHNHASATFINNATVQFQGASTRNDAGALIENAGDWTALAGSSITNLGAVNNRGKMAGISIINSGTFTNFAGATLDPGTGIVRTESSGTLVNHGTISIADSNFELAAGSRFDFTGGTLNNEALGHITLRRDFVLGDAKSGVVNLSVLGSLRNYATLSVAQGYTQNAGGSVINFSGGIFKVNGTLNSQDLFNNQGAQLNNNGHIDVADVLINAGHFTNKGTVLIHGGQLINQAGATLDNLGGISFALGLGKLLNQGTLNNGGVDGVDAQIALERNQTYDFTGGILNNRANGTLMLYSGTHFALGDAQSGVVNLGAGGRVRIDDGASLVNQSGHTQVNQGQIIASTGGLLQNDGILVNHGKILGGQINNNGTILGSGSIEVGDGGAIIAGSVTQSNVTLTRGTMRLQTGGSLQVNTFTVSAFEGTVLHDHNVVVTAQGGVNNEGHYFFQGAGGTINGKVHNLEGGTIQVNSSRAVINGTLTNDGRYLSSNAFNSFADLIVTTGGWVSASHADFLITGDFLNHSTQAKLWDTTKADLLLFGNGLHQIGVAGADLGASRAGYVSNFAWSALSLGTGSRYDVVDGNASVGGALYVGLIDLQDGLTQLQRISSDYNIYYDALLAGNAYLGGRTYAFGGGSGHLIGITSAAAVPEPQEGALVVGGLSVLAVWFRRRRAI